MLLSDRDIRTQIDSGRVALEPYEPDMIQPSSIDARSASTRSVHRVADQPPVLHGGAFPLDSHCAETMTPCSSVEAATELVSDRLATKSRGPDDH